MLGCDERGQEDSLFADRRPRLTDTGVWKDLRGVTVIRVSAYDEQSVAAQPSSDEAVVTIQVVA